MIKIGNKLKNAINKSGYSQLDIAKYLNVSKDTISNYINDKYIPRLDILIKICEIVNVPIQNIIYDIDVSNIDDVFYNKFVNLNTKQKEIIIDYIEFLENKNNQKSLNLKDTENLKPEKNDTG